MIDIRSVLKTVLLADVTVAALVGSSRVYPGILPQGVTATSVVQNLISEDTDYHMQGASGLAAARIQIDGWAQGQDAAVALANAVKDRLSGFSGTVSFGSNSPQDTASIKSIFAASARDDYDDTAKMHRRSRDYIVWYYERA